MKDWNKMEDHIRKSLEKDYPYDEKLWQDAQKQLSVVFPSRAKKIGFYGAVIGLLAIGTWLLWFLKPDHASSLAEVKTSGTSNEVQEKSPALSSGLSNKGISPSRSMIENQSSSPTTEDQLAGTTNPSPNPMGPSGVKQTGETPPTGQIPTGNPDPITPMVSGTTDDPDETGSTEDHSGTDKAGSADQIREEDSQTKKWIPLDVPKVSSKGGYPAITWEIAGALPGDTAIPERAFSPMNHRFFAVVDYHRALFNNGSVPDNDPEWNSKSNLRNSIVGGNEFQVRGGINIFDRFNVQLGVGQTTFTDRFTAQKKQTTMEPVYDTFGSYFVVLNKEYMPVNRPVWLIQKKYEVSERIDTTEISELVYDQTDQIRYWNIPLRIGYTLPLNRFEVKAQLGLDYLFAPKLRTEFKDPLYQNEIRIREGGLRSSLLRPNMGLMVGYRMNYHISVYTELRGSFTTKNLYQYNSFGFRSGDVGFGLHYRF